MKILVEEKGIQIKGRVKVITTDSRTGKFLREIPFKDNLIMFGTNCGRDLILKRLAGDNTYSLNILYADIGTSSTVPAISDTQITAAVTRSSNPVITQASNIVSFQFFFADANLPNGAYNEIGTFVDGSATINTGQIFNHALFATTYNKASNEDSTIQIDYTIN